MTPELFLPVLKDKVRIEIRNTFTPAMERNPNRAVGEAKMNSICGEGIDKFFETAKVEIKALQTAGVSMDRAVDIVSTAYKFFLVEVVREMKARGLQ